MSVAPLSINSLPLCILHRIFNELSPRDLSRASSVCQLWRQLNRDNSGELRWRRLYSSRWSLENAQKHELSFWCDVYRQKVAEANVWQGKYSQDALIGHRASIRSIQILPQFNLLASGSVDRTVKLWDLSGGMLISSSRMHDNSVRALLMEKDSTEDNICVFSGSESTIRVWKIALTSNSKEFGKPQKLKGHSGPVSCLGSTPTLLLSGSWDCRVSLWRKEDGALVRQLAFPDWIWALDVKQEVVSVACGKAALIHDLESDVNVLGFDGVLQNGHITCCEMTEDRRALFTGASDGIVRQHDLRSKRQITEIDFHSSGVTDLSFEDPWIAVSSLDGTISLRNLESRLHPTFLTRRRGLERTNRHLACPSGPIYCLQMTNHWLVCGAEQSTIRTWDFSRAMECANQAGISRLRRQQRRVRRISDSRISHHNETSHQDGLSHHDESTLQGETSHRDELSHHSEVTLQDETSLRDKRSHQNKTSHHHVESISEQEVVAGAGDVSYDGMLRTRCRFGNRPQWNSFSGESTDESEIIEAFG